MSAGWLQVTEHNVQFSQMSHRAYKSQGLKVIYVLLQYLYE